MTRDLRFGVNLFGTGSGTEFIEQVRAVADAGADVVLVPDHLGFIAPMPALVAAAGAAPGLRVGTFVLNAGFYRPALLARDLATVDQLTGGRLEIGLGAGYIEDEFTAAGLPFERPGRRVDHLAEVVDHVRAATTDPGHVPAFVQKPAPIMIAGVRDRVLSLAARSADIVAFANLPDLETARERVAYVREQAGSRFDDLELNVIVFDLAVDRPADTSAVAGANPEADEATLLRSPNLLHGSVDEVVERILEIRRETGISYFTFIEPSTDDLRALAAIIARLR